MATSQTAYNNPVQVVKAAGEITGTYAELVDLGKTYERRGLLVDITLDQDVILRFGGGREIKVFVGREMGMDNYAMIGLIEVKYLTAQPATGQLNVIVW